MADASTPPPTPVRAQPPAAARPSEGYALVLLGATLFVVNAGVSRLVLDAGVPPDRLASLRSLGTAGCLLVWVALTGRLRTLALRRDELGLVVVYGVVGVAGVQWTYFVAIDRLPIGIALLLQYLAPVLIALWARVVAREDVKATLWPALGLCLAGLALVARVGSAQGRGLDPVGVAAALAAAVCFAAYFLLGERIVRRRDPLSTTFWGFAVATVFTSVAAPWWTVPREVLTGTGAMPDVLGGGDAPVRALLVWVVVLGTLVPFAAETSALRHIPATAVSLVATLEPVGAALLAWWWFEESLDVVQVVGVLLVVGGIGLAVVARRGSTAPLAE